MQVELKHTLTVDKSAWFIRFYLWLWEADVETITFCKLFWAYVFVVPGVLIRFGVAEPIGKWIAPLIARHKAARAAKPIEDPTPTRPLMQPFLNHIETTGSRLVMWCSAIWNVVGLRGRLAPILGRLLVGLGIAAGAAAVVAIVYLAVVNFGVTQWVLVAVACIASWVAVVMALMALGVFERLGYGIARGALGAKRGFLAFCAALGTGYAAVKSNTCPRVEIK